MNSEEIKNIVDSFGRLSFVLETWVKLKQTGDFEDLCLSAHLSACDEVKKLNYLLNPTEHESR